MKLQICVRIHIRHIWLLLLCILTAAAAPQYCLRGVDRSAAAAIPDVPYEQQPATRKMRTFYLTEDTHKGNAADGYDGNGAGVCAQGYHFASLWEIVDPSNLIYNTQLGHSLADSGMGPPSFDSGWIRTGYDQSSSTTPGMGNCQLWNETSAYGTTISLVDNWSNPNAQDVHVWDAAFRSCNDAARVWCVANEIGHKIYFPIAIR